MTGTMDCTDFKNWLDDRDMPDAREAGSAADHMDICCRCRRLFEADSWVEEAVDESLTPVAPPVRLLRAVHKDKECRERKGPTARVPWKFIVPALAAAVLVLVLVNPWHTSLDGIDRMATLAVKGHMSGDRSMSFKAGEVADPAAWFRERVGFEATPPDKIDGGLRFIGGRPCRLGRARAAILFYEQRGTNVSLFIVHVRNIDFDLEHNRAYHTSVRGCTVKIWRNANLVYAQVT